MPRGCQCRRNTQDAGIPSPLREVKSKYSYDRIIKAQTQKPERTETFFKIEISEEAFKQDDEKRGAGIQRRGLERRRRGWDQGDDINYICRIGTDLACFRRPVTSVRSRKRRSFTASTPACIRRGCVSISVRLFIAPHLYVCGVP